MSANTQRGTSDDAVLEYRVCWNAASNASFHGHTDWSEANEGETQEDIESSLAQTDGHFSDGLGMALDASGFDWWIETRPTEAGDE